MYLPGGLETEKDYPYDGSDDKCTFNKSEVAVKITGALNISTNEDGNKYYYILLYHIFCFYCFIHVCFVYKICFFYVLDMKVWLYKNGPISIGINANGMQVCTYFIALLS